MSNPLYETIRLIPAQKQDGTGTGSSLPSGISAPPGLDPPESRADTTRPPVGPSTCPLRQMCQYCPLPCCRCDSTHVLHRCKQLGSRRLLSLGDGFSSPF